MKLQHALSIPQAARAFAAGLLLALVGPSTSLLHAATVQSNDPIDQVGRLAVNFDELRDWNPTWVFTDAMKIARPWLSQIPGSLAPWNTGAPINADPNGWPILNFGQSAATLLFHEVQADYPGGVYNVFWDGVGTMEYDHDASLLQHVGPGHDQIFVSPSDLGMIIKISTSDANNHVRNVRVILPGFESTYTTQTFHPEFLAALEPFGALRYMQWQNTNFPVLQHWWERPTKDTWTQSLDIGMAAEYMVELANLTGKSPWFCMPHTATDDFIREFGRFVAQNLNPQIPAFVEFSNEVWNNTFPAFHYAASNGLALGLGAGAPPDSVQFHAAWKFYAERSVRAFDLWTQEFQAVPGPPVGERLVRVLAGQHANPYVGETILDHNQAYTQADAFAVAPYMGFSFGLDANVYTSLNKPNSQILAELTDELYNTLVPVMAQNVQVANSRGLDLIAYEGGQHLVGVGGSAQSNQQLTDKFVSVNRDPGMYSLYMQFLAAWEASGAEFMTPYSFCGRYTEFGSWGHLEYLNQPLSEAHKHRALVDWAGGGGTPPPPPVNPEVFYYGAACQNLWMGHYGEPRIGESLFVTVGNVPPYGTATLQVSFTNQSFGGVPLPLNLSGLGLPGCSLLVGAGLPLTTQADGSGSLNQELQIPDDPALAGAVFYVQWSVNLPSFGSLGIGLSNALAITIGS